RPPLPRPRQRHSPCPQPPLTRLAPMYPNPHNSDLKKQEDSMKWNQSLSLVALGLFALATPAWAQKEQWLEYHTDREGKGYRYLDLTTNPPPNVALPKLAAQPYFARWTSPLDASGGRWICFDRTRKAGPHDRLYIDTNGNGRLDDDAPVSTFRTDQYTAYFEPAKVTFKGEDGPITYHLALRFMKYEGSDVRVLASSAGYYAGQVDLGGKKQHLELIDGNVNGTFNDRSTNSGDCDRVSVEKDSTSERYLGKLLEANGQFFQIEVARDGAFVKLQKADVTLGQARVPETISEFVAFGENGHFVRKPAKGEFTLPAGKYHILQWTINRKDNKGAKWELMGYNLPEKASFEVAAAKLAAIQVGEPVRADLRAEPTKTKGQLTFNLNFRGRFDESIQILKDSQRPPGPKLSFASADGSYRATNTFEFG
ncbi:MAG TPA: hypothetical protein VNZ22_11395, partial [Bacillota bacterium]|nr:hypothetical protein [Bacillota bacterium]